VTLTSRLRSTFLELVQLSGPPGSEDPVSSYVRSKLGDECAVDIDVAGNVVARRGEGETVVLLAAHLDEVGFVITRIEERGLLRFALLGGPVRLALPGSLVRIGELNGVIGFPEMIIAPADEQHVLSPDELFIDIGATSADEARSWGVRVGDPVSYCARVTVVGRSGHVIVTKSVDNRVGCAIVLDALVQPPPSGVTLIGLFTVQEEVGWQGARMAMRSLRADCAIVLDDTLVEDGPTYPPPLPETPVLGGGPALCLVETAAPTLSHITPRRVREWVRQTAETAGLRVQTRFLFGSGSDAVEIATSHAGLATAYIGIPNRYSHSATELLDLRDLDATAALVSALIASAAKRPWLSL
jgi:endoglucanase